MVELIPRSRLTKVVETAPAALGADPDARVRIPQFGLTDHLDQGSVEVVCEITWDGLVWSELGRDTFTPKSKARDGSPASVSYALTVWGEDDKPRSPLASRYRLIPTGSPTLEAAVTERREPTATPQVRHHSIALVQSAEKVVSSPATSTTLAYGSDITADNLLCDSCVCVAETGATIQTPTDTRSSSYAAMATQQDLAGGIFGIRNYYAVAPSSGASTVTFSQTNSGFFTVVIAEFSGAATTTPLDGGTGTTGTGTAASPGNVTPSEDNTLIFAAMTHLGSNRTLTEEAGWSLVQEHEGGSGSLPISVIYKVQTTATTEDADWTIGTGSVDWGATCGVFKAAAASGASGTGAFTQPMQTLSGTGKKSYPGTGALTQPTQVLAGTGKQKLTGTGTLVQPVQLLNGTGQQAYPGSGAFTLPAQVLAGTGKQALAGSGAFILPMQLLAGTGAAGGPLGTGALTQPMQTLAGSGVVIPVGTGAFIIPAQALSGTGKQALAGSGAFILPAQVLTGTGAAGGVVGIGALMQPFQALTGSGKQALAGIGAFAVPVQVLTGAGAQTFAGAGAFTQPMQALAGSGLMALRGTGSLAVPVQTLVGAGKQALGGSGAIAVPMQLLSGTGLIVPSGIGAFVLPMQILAGTGLGGAVPDVLGRVVVFDEPAWRMVIFDEPVWRVLVFDEPVWRVTVTD